MKSESKQVHSWNLADTITSARIAASLTLLFLPLHSAWFLVVYTFAGLTDVLDGWLARQTGKASEFGARLDSIADLLFYGILLLRLFPALWQTLPAVIWYAVATVLIVRLAAYATAFLKFHRFASLHTWLNKLTGASIFCLPYVLSATAGIAYSWGVCILAFFASGEELLIHLRRKEYCSNTRGIARRQSEDKKEGFFNETE